MKFILIGGVLVMSVLASGADICYKGILQNYLVTHLCLSEKRAQELLDGIYDGIEDAKEFNSIIKVHPIEMIAILEAESSGKNIMGDEGKAVGYFQLHWEAIWFVWSYFPHLKREEFKKQPLSVFIDFPYTQARLATLYLYLLKIQFGDDAYSAYNGWNDAYAEQIRENIKRITDYCTETFGPILVLTDTLPKEIFMPAEEQTVFITPVTTQDVLAMLPQYKVFGDFAYDGVKVAIERFLDIKIDPVPDDLKMDENVTLVKCSYSIIETYDYGDYIDGYPAIDNEEPQFHVYEIL